MAKLKYEKWKNYALTTKNKFFSDWLLDSFLRKFNNGYQNH